MTLFQSPIPYVEPRDDLTIPQFVFSETFEHPTKSADVGKFPCMIEEETGRKVYLSEVRVSLCTREANFRLLSLM